MNLYKKITDRWYNKLPAGEFRGLFSLIWIGPGRRFIYLPHSPDPFTFIRSTGEEITPGVMLTDAGSIPQLLHSFIDPWTYLPGFIIHDWEFSKNVTGKSFSDVNETLAEAIKTQMVDGYLNTKKPEEDSISCRTIYSGVDSFIGKNIWKGNKQVE